MVRRRILQRRILREPFRTLCGPKQESSVYRRRFNFELEREFGSEDE
jgi:hypothetical protein